MIIYMQSQKRMLSVVLQVLKKEADGSLTYMNQCLPSTEGQVVIYLYQQVVNTF